MTRTPSESRRYLLLASLSGATLPVVSTEARRLLRAWLDRMGARVDDLERRFASLERIVFEIDGIERRVAELEQQPPRPLGGLELQRQRAEAVLRARSQGFSHGKIAKATGVSKAGVRRILIREGDPAPERLQGTDGRRYSMSQNGDGSPPR